MANKQIFDFTLASGAELSLNSRLELQAIAGADSVGITVGQILALVLGGTVTVSAFARTLLDDAAASNARTTLGLGTAAVAASGDFQPIDADLTAIAALTTTSYGRALLTLADAAALAALVDSFFLTPTEGNAAYQPLDSDLTAIAALSTTSYGRSLLTLANQAALIAEVASAYQPLDSDLTAIAALTTTSYGRAFLALADAAAARTAIDAAPASLSIVTDSTTARTLGLTDAGKWIRMTNGSPNTVTVDTNANVGFPVGTPINVIQIGAGTTTIVAAGGVTINATPSLIARTQFSGMTLVKVGTDTWDLVGDMA